MVNHESITYDFLNNIFKFVKYFPLKILPFLDQKYLNFNDCLKLESKKSLEGMCFINLNNINI